MSGVILESADAKLLEDILAAANTPSPPRPDDETPLLSSLLAAAPKNLRPLRKSTLFEAIHVLDLENPHSDFLAWLLDPLGPLTGNWLLRMLLERIAPEQPWDDNPTIEREAVIDDGRLDVLITWDSFKLIIENKVWSSEGEGQIARYLQSGEIDHPQDGRIMYLTPQGRRPKSIGDNEKRVTAISYLDLVEMLNDGIASGKEQNERGRIFAEEFRDCIEVLLRIRHPMNKPQLSESTKIFLAHAKRLTEIKEHAIEESVEFLQWMYSEAAKRLEKLLGPEFVMEPSKWVVLFRRSDWKHGEVPFGFDFCMNADPQKYLLSERADGPFVGVGVGFMDGSLKKSELQPITDRLHAAIRNTWKHASDLSNPDYENPLWREMPIPPDGTMDKWAEEIIGFLEELASTLTPSLQRVATEFANK